MALLKRRDRMVVFRLTQEEYKRLLKACARTGARNLSDYTRAQLLDRAATKGIGEGIETRLSRFDRRLSELEAMLNQMNRLLKQMST
jgi:hypothetical protein